MTKLSPEHAYRAVQLAALADRLRLAERHLVAAVRIARDVDQPERSAEYARLAGRLNAEERTIRARGRE